MSAQTSESGPQETSEADSRSRSAADALKLAPLSAEHQALHARAHSAARELRSAEARLIEVLIAVEKERLFLKLGFSSLYVYCVEALRLSEAMAYNAITVSRKAREVPALRASLSSGAIGISTAKKIALVLTRENQEEWLSKARTLTTRQLEKAVAEEAPEECVPERAKYVSGNRLALTLGIDEELLLKLRRAQDQVSRSRGKAVSLEETLSETLAFYLRHKDPVEKAKRVNAKKGLSMITAPAASSANEAITHPSDSLKTRFTGTVNRVDHSENEKPVRAKPRPRAEPRPRIRPRPTAVPK